MRRLVEFAKNIAEFAAIIKARSEARSIHFPQGADERVAVLPANFSVLVAVAIVESRLFHGSLPVWRDY